MKKYVYLFTLMLAALFSNITASAQSLYVSSLLVDQGGTSILDNALWIGNINEGRDIKEVVLRAFQTRDLEEAVTDVIAVKCGSSVTSITYNGLTYTVSEHGGLMDPGTDINYYDKAPEMHLFFAKGPKALGGEVITGFQLHVVDSQMDDNGFVKVMNYSNGTVTPLDNNDLKKGAGGKYVYLEPVYSTITETSFYTAYCEDVTQGSGTADDPYLLSTAGHLYWFSCQVANGNEYICGKLTADITVNEGVLNADGTFSGKSGLKPWLPIGNYEHAFRGKLIGDGHIISGLYINDEERQYMGLVGYGVAAEISGIGVTDTYFAGRTNVGGIAGTVVSQNSEQGSTIKECFFQGTMSSKFYCGGIASVCGNYSLVADCYACFLPLNKKSNYGGIIGTYDYGSWENCYYDGDLFGSTDSPSGITSKTSAAFASGEVASLLNHGVETGEETFRQRISKDAAPHFSTTKDSYVFKTADGTYTNDCPHLHMEAHPAVAATCINEGCHAYWYCPHPACQCDYLDEKGSLRTDHQFFITPRAGATEPYGLDTGTYFKWEYEESLYFGHRYYDNALYLHTEQWQESLNATYRAIVVPALIKACGGKFKYYAECKMNGNITVRFYVNGVEVSEHTQALGFNESADGTIVLNDYDDTDVFIVEVQYARHKVLSSDPANVIIYTEEARELPNPLPREHKLTFQYGDDCLIDGHEAYYKCEICGVMFPVDQNDVSQFDESHKKSDEGRVEWEDLQRTALTEHYFKGLKANADGLYSQFCPTCGKQDPRGWIAMEGIADADYSLRADPEKGYVAFAPLNLKYGENYRMPVDFTADLTYTVPVYAKGWSSWSVPFEVTTNQLAEEGFDAAYIEGIHRYDTDDDGTIDRTTLEVIRITNGTLRAGTPYLIRPQGDKTSLTLSIDGATLYKDDELHLGHTETMMAAYDFVPTYVTVPAEEAEGNYYIVGAENKLGPTSSYVCALDWYLKITDKGSPFDALQGAQSIAIRTVGEQDETTGIFTPYAPDEQTEEIYDLSGRRLDTIPAQGLYIQGNKVKMGK